MVVVTGEGTLNITVITVNDDTMTRDEGNRFVLPLMRPLSGVKSAVSK